MGLGKRRRRGGPERARNEDSPGADAIALRPAVADDAAFLFEVFASTREPERGLATWDDAAWEEFVRMQFDAQRRHYARHFPGAEQSVVFCDGMAVGRIWVFRAESEMRLLDIAILPEHRNLGIGTRLLRGLQEEARAAGVPLRHSVELGNSGARRLYERLGFAAIETRGLHTLMEWVSPASFLET